MSEPDPPPPPDPVADFLVGLRAIVYFLLCVAAVFIALAVVVQFPIVLIGVLSGIALVFIVLFITALGRELRNG